MFELTDNRLCFVSLQAKDLESVARFYRDVLGVPLHLGEDYPHFECSWNNPYLHFAIFPSTNEQPKLSFAVDDLDAAHARAVAVGAVVVSEPKEEPWGRSAEYRDPDGNIVSLVELQ